MVPNLVPQSREHTLHLYRIGVARGVRKSHRCRARRDQIRGHSHDPVLGDGPLHRASKSGRDAGLHGGTRIGRDATAEFARLPHLLDGLLRRHANIRHAVLPRGRDGEAQFVDAGGDATFRAFQIRRQRQHRQPVDLHEPPAPPARHRPSAAAASGETKDPTSISRKPAPASAAIQRCLTSVGIARPMLCSPSRGPTSLTRTSISEVSGMVRRLRSYKTLRTIRLRAGRSSGIGRLTQVTCM